MPIPKDDSLDAISERLIAGLDARMQTDRNAEGRTIAERYPDEFERMIPLPERSFRPAATRLVEVTRRSLVKVEGAFYSVPCAWAGLSVTAYLDVNHIEIVGPKESRICHPRAVFGRRSIDYRHYLPELAKKPQAVRQVADELIRDLGPPFDRLWRELVDRHGPREAARTFARVLDALGTLGHAETTQRVEQALATDEPVLIALRTRTNAKSSCAVPSSLDAVEVESGRAADFDALLGGAS